MKLNATLIAIFALLLALPGSALAAPKAKMRFTSSVVVAAEGSQAVVTVTRAKRTGNAKSFTNMAASVDYSTSAGTAGAADYTNVSGTLNFAPGDAEESFTVPTAQDTEIEGAETVNLALSAPSRSAVIVNPSTATLSIADDDGPTQLQFSPASYTVSEAAGNAELTVVRSGDVAVQSTVAYGAVGGTAGSSDYTAPAVGATLTFAAGELNKTISIPVVNDSVVGEGTEDFSIELSSPSNAVFPNNALKVSASVGIVDDDTVSGNPELSFSAGSYSGAENGNGIAVTVVRAGPVNRDVSALIKSIAGTAADGVDYETLDDIVEFDSGDVTQTLSLALKDDAADELDESFEVALSAPAGGTLASPSSATLTILDDDQTPVVVEVPGEQQQAPETPAPVVNVTNNTTTVNNTTFVNPLAAQPGILVLGARIGSCKLNIGTFKAQRILRAKLVRVKLHAVEACTGTVKSHVKGRKSLRGAKKGAIQTKVVKFALKEGQSKTIKMRFSKRGYKFLKRALGKQKTLNAALLVRSTDSSKRVTLSTLRWKAKR